MVILSHMRSLTSRPDSGEAIALATEAMSECRDKLKSSKPEDERKGTLRIRLQTGSDNQEEALTFGLGHRGGGGDGAEGGAAREGRVGPGHRHGVAHPRRRVDGSDRFICRGGGEHGDG